MANIFHIERTANKITLGTASTTINIASHTASKTLALDGSKNLESIQDLRTTASPTFVGLTIVNAITEFSTDGTMAGNSDSAVPTEKATKLYTDTLRSDLASVSNAKGASLVGVEDSAAQFDATNVEAALSELIVLVTPVEYNPAMSRTAGGDAGGNDASVATIDDADSYDTDEVNATPGFDIQAVFTGVTDFNQVQIHTAYDGNPAHVIRIDLDKTPFNWSSFDTILADIDDSSGDFVFKAITVASAAQYINSGEVRLRFYHSSAGNATHDFFIDYCALWKTGTSVGVTEHGGLTGLLDDDHLQYIKDVEFTQNSGILVGTGAGTFQEETGATLRTSIGLGNVENTQLSTWAGSSNITTLGTIATGVWEGTSIAVGYTDAKCVAVWPDTYTADQNLLEASTPIFAGLTVSEAVSTFLFLKHITNTSYNTIQFYEDTTPLAEIIVLGTNHGTVSRRNNLEITTKNAGDIILQQDNVNNVGIGLNSPKTLLTIEGTLTLKEQAAADGDTAAYGQDWVKNTSPCTRWFTDDEGNDIQLGTGGTYVDRGDPAAWDWVDANLTTDGNWNDLDLSSIVPAGAKTVLLRVRIIDDATDKAIQMRENGNSNGYNVAALVTLVANLSTEGNFVVGCDADRVIEYNASNTSWTNIDICVRGWWT